MVEVAPPPYDEEAFCIFFFNFQNLNCKEAWSGGHDVVARDDDVLFMMMYGS